MSTSILGKLGSPEKHFKHMGIHHTVARYVNPEFDSSHHSIQNNLDKLFSFIDENNKTYFAVTSLFRNRAFKRAKELDSMRTRAPLSVLPLLGVPFLVKENIAVEKEKLQCASKILEGYSSPYSATIVQRIEEAGGIIIGSTNMDEFAMGSSCEHSCHGVTRNPYDLDSVPGGSSGGGAAAQALGFCNVSLGSDTGGSVRQPASFCNVYGFKPTFGVNSRYGLVAFGSSLDQISPFTRSIADLIEVMAVTAGSDEKDATSLSSKLPFSDLLPLARSNQQESDLSKYKVGVPWKLIESCCSSEVFDTFQKFVEKIEGLGVQVKEIEFPDLEVALPVYYVLSSAEASSNLSRFDGLKYGKREQGLSREEVIKQSRSLGFGKEVQRRILLGSFVLSSGYYEAYYGKAMMIRNMLAKNYADLFSSFHFVLTPTTPTTAFKIGENLSDPVQMYANDVLTIPPSLVGLPALSIPVATRARKPLGLQIVGAKCSDVSLLGFALQLERLNLCGIEDAQ